MSTATSDTWRENETAGNDGDAQMQSRLLQSNEKLTDLLDCIPDQILILNPDGKTVFLNQAAVAFTGMAMKQAIGLRPGELYHCANADAGTCGQTKYCRLCGMHKAFLASRRNAKVMQDYTVTNTSLQTSQFRIWTIPRLIDNTMFSMMIVRDISILADKAMLEELLLHQMKDHILSVERQLDDVQKNPLQTETAMAAIQKIADAALEIITGQEELLAAEHNTLNPQISSVNSIREIQKVIQKMDPVCRQENKQILLDQDSDRVNLTTDAGLLRHVLHNMIENALAATPPEEQVIVGCRNNGSLTDFSVYNNACMPEDIQLQLFKRHFSSHDQCRGMGAYCARLLTEKYLGGQISYVSSPAHGTTFTLTIPTNSRPPTV